MNSDSDELVTKYMNRFSFKISPRTQRVYKYIQFKKKTDLYFLFGYVKTQFEVLLNVEKFGTIKFWGICVFRWL